MLQRWYRQFWGRTHTKRTKKRICHCGSSVVFICSYVWLSQTSYSPKTGEEQQQQWLTWAYHIAYCSSVCTGQTVPVPPSHSHIPPALLSPHFTVRNFLFFIPSPSSWGSKLFLIQSPKPILRRPLLYTHRHPSATRRLLTLPHFLPNPGSCTISQRKHSSLSAQTCRQKPYSVYMRGRK